MNKNKIIEISKNSYFLLEGSELIYFSDYFESEFLFKVEKINLRKVEFIEPEIDENTETLNLIFDASLLMNGLPTNQTENLKLLPKVMISFKKENKVRWEKRVIPDRNMSKEIIDNLNKILKI